MSTHKQSYFVSSTPNGLDGAQYLAVNRDGSVLYGLKVRIVLSIVEAPEQAPEVITTATEKSICKYHVASGNTKTFQLDDDIDPLLLARIIEFYMISDNIVALISYDSEHFQVIQTLIHLEHSKEWAQTIVVRRLTISRMSGPPLVNLSFLDKGRILLCGGRASVEGVKERMTINIAANPLNCFTKPDEDLSSLMEDFNKFLTSRPSDVEAKSLISLFLLHLDEEKISVLLSEVYPDDPQSEPVFATNVMGMINRKDGTFSVEQLDNSALSICEPLIVTSIVNMRAKRGNVWMTFSVRDVEKLNTLYWRFKHFYVGVMLRLMVIGFQGSMYLWRFDNGFTFHCLTRFFMFLHGPTMIPIYSPQKQFHLCYLDINRRRFFRYEHSARVLKSKMDPNETEFAMGFDVDSDGGALVLDHPTEKSREMELSYYRNPMKPQSLAQLATYSAYRNFPSFEKSSLLRRLTGVIDWMWSI